MSMHQCLPWCKEQMPLRHICRPVPSEDPRDDRLPGSLDTGSSSRPFPSGKPFQLDPRPLSSSASLGDSSRLIPGPDAGWSLPWCCRSPEGSPTGSTPLSCGANAPPKVWLPKMETKTSWLAYMFGKNLPVPTLNKLYIKTCKKALCCELILTHDVI